MNKHKTGIVDTFTQLMVYTLEFSENSQKEVYTIEKLIADYEVLITEAKKTFKEKIFIVDFDDALFPVVSWIDEVILSSKFKEKKMWRRTLLQKKFFNTSNAGDEFYDKLNNLPSNAFDLRLLYLYCLFLGFKGKYYRVEDKDSLSSVFEKEIAMVDDDFSDNFPKYAFKYAYSQNPSLEKKSFKASYKGLWVLISVSLLAGLIIFLGLQSHLNALLSKYNIF